MDEENEFTSYTLDWDPGFKEASLKVLEGAGLELGEERQLPRRINSTRGDGLFRQPHLQTVDTVDEVIKVRLEKRPWGIKYVFSQGGSSGEVIKEDIEVLEIDSCDTDLVALYCSGCRCLKDVGSISKLKELRELELSFCKCLEDLNGLSTLTQLTKLDLGFCESLTDLQFLKSLVNLEELGLGYCKLLTDLSVLSGAIQLRELDLSSCCSLSDVKALTKLTHLERLKLIGCSSLRELNPLSGLKRLKILYLDGFMGDFEALSRLTQLQVLSLGSCKSLTEVSFLSEMSKLEELSLRGCESLTDVSGVSGLIQLESLSLRDCPYVRESDLQFLFSFTRLDGFSHSNPVFQIHVILNSALLRGDFNSILWVIEKALKASSRAQDFDLASTLLRAYSFLAKYGDEESLEPTTVNSEKLNAYFETVYAFENSCRAFWKVALEESATVFEEALMQWLFSKFELGAIRLDLFEGFLDFISDNDIRGGDGSWLKCLNQLLDKTKSEKLPQLGPKICLAYRCLGEADRADQWLKRLTGQGDTSFRDRVLACYAEHDLSAGNHGSAQQLLGGIEDSAIADTVRALLVRALAASAPGEAGALLEEVLHRDEKAALAADLQEVSSFTELEANLERLLLIQSTDPEAFASLLRRLLEQSPGSTWLQELKAHLLPAAASAEAGPDVAGIKREFMKELLDQGYLDWSQASAANALIEQGEGKS